MARSSSDEGTRNCSHKSEQLQVRHSAPGRANGVLVLAIGTLSAAAHRGQDMPCAQRLHRSMVGTAAQFLQFIDLSLSNRADVLHHDPADAFGAGRRCQGAVVTIVVQVVGDVSTAAGPLFKSTRAPTSGATASRFRTIGLWSPMRNSKPTTAKFPAES